jgi:hypothetical protein
MANGLSDWDPPFPDMLKTSEFILCLALESTRPIGCSSARTFDRTLI